MLPPLHPTPAVDWTLATLKSCNHEEIASWRRVGNGPTTGVPNGEKSLKITWSLILEPWLKDISILLSCWLRKLKLKHLTSLCHHYGDKNWQRNWVFIVSHSASQQVDLLLGISHKLIFPSKCSKQTPPDNVYIHSNKQRVSSLPVIPKRSKFWSAHVHIQTNGRIPYCVNAALAEWASGVLLSSQQVSQWMKVGLMVLRREVRSLF